MICEYVTVILENVMRVAGGPSLTEGAHKQRTVSHLRSHNIPLIFLHTASMRCQAQAISHAFYYKVIWHTRGHGIRDMMYTPRILHGMLLSLNRCNTSEEEIDGTDVGGKRERKVK